jgi:hypothetical protein
VLGFAWENLATRPVPSSSAHPQVTTQYIVLFRTMANKCAYFVNPLTRSTLSSSTHSRAACHLNQIVTAAVDLVRSGAGTEFG